MAKSILSRIKSRKYSVFTSWLLSYFLLLLIPLLTSSVIYFEWKRIIEREISNVHSALLKQIRISLDNAILNTNQLFYQIGLNNKFKRLLYESGSVRDIDRDLLHEVVNDFTEYIRDSLYSEDVYIYLKETDIVLTTSGLRSSASHYNLYYRNSVNYSGISYKEWRDILEERYSTEGGLS